MDEDTRARWHPSYSWGLGILAVFATCAAIVLVKAAEMEDFFACFPPSHDDCSDELSRAQANSTLDYVCATGLVVFVVFAVCVIVAKSQSAASDPTSR